MRTSPAYNAAAEGLRTQPKAEFAISRSATWIDTALVALVFGAILFNIVLGKLSVILVLVATAAIILLRWERLPAVFIRCWPLFSVALVCLASTLWSVMPGTSLYYAALYTVTVLTGVLIGSALSRNSYIDGHFIAFAIFGIACVFFGRSVTHINAMAFAGLAGSKNSMGDMAGVGIIVSIAFVWLKVYEGKLVQAAFALAIIPMFFLLLLETKATGALISTVGASALVVVWLISRQFELQLRSALFALSVVGVLIAAATTQFWVEPVFDLIIEASGKDQGLTGRVYLWAVGDKMIAENPVLGIGYSAFWQSDNLDAKLLGRIMGLADFTGFNFHNTVMDITVDLGYFGLAVTILMAVYASVSLLYRATFVPHFSSICACALLAFWTVKLPLEMIAFDPMNFNTVTMYAIFAMGLRHDAASRSPNRYRSQ